MPGMFSLTLDTSRVAGAFARLKQAGPIAVARGINRTANSEKTAMSRDISKDMGLKVGVVKDALTVRTATAGNLTALVTVTGGRIPLIDFSARGPNPSRGRGRGVTARLPPPGAGRYPSAFLATMRSGHVGVFQRTGKGRLPIYELHGPSIVHVFERYVPLGAARRSEVLLKNVQHEIQFALSKLT